MLLLELCKTTNLQLTRIASKRTKKKKNTYSMVPCCGDLIHPLRAIPRDSLFPFQLLEIEILIEKYPLRVSLSGYPNIAIIYFRFLASQR